MGKTIKIHVMTDWSSTDVEHQRLRRFSPNRSGRWKNIELCDDFHEADLYIACWGSKSKGFLTKAIKRCPPNSVINISNERKQRIPERKIMKSISRNTLANFWITEYFIPGKWWVNKTYSELVKTPFPSKSKIISCITSGKYRSRGQKLRIDFLKAFTRKYPGILDLYGRDIEKMRDYKGPLEDKWDGLAPYRYVFAFNNFSERNYFDEKLFDPILAGCMPFFWGCPNIGDFFPEGSYVYLDISKKDAIDKAMKVMKSDYREKNLQALENAKNLILNKLQFWPAIHSIINELVEEGRYKPHEILGAHP